MKHIQSNNRTEATLKDPPHCSTSGMNHRAITHQNIYIYICIKQKFIRLSNETFWRPVNAAAGAQVVDENEKLQEKWNGGIDGLNGIVRNQPFCHETIIHPHEAGGFQIRNNFSYTNSQSFCCVTLMQRLDTNVSSGETALVWCVTCLRRVGTRRLTALVWTQVVMHRRAAGLTCAELWSNVT